MDKEKELPSAVTTDERVTELEHKVRLFSILHFVEVILFCLMLLGLAGRVDILTGDVARLRQIVDRIVDGLREENGLLQQILDTITLLH